MPITKARLDRMIDMIDSAWLKWRDSENTNPKKFFEPPSARQPPIAESHNGSFYSAGAPQRIHGEPSKKDLFG